MRRIILSLLVVSVCVIAYPLPAQHPSSLQIDMLRLLRNPAALRFSAEQLSAGLVPAGDLIVGYPNPNEVREINSPMTIAGNIIVVNNGQLRFNNVETRLQGNILLLHNGKMEVNGGVFGVNQIFLYQYRMLLANKAAVTFRNTHVRFGGFNFACGLADTTLLLMDMSGFSEGIMTTTAAGSATVSAAGTQRPGELLFFDRSRGTFSNCDGMLTWFTAPSQSGIDLSLPGNNIPGQYAFPDSARTATGIDTRLSFSTCYNTLWGLISQPGSNVRVTNSTLAACGIMFTGAGDLTVRNLLNNSDYESFRLPATDRDLRFVNTSVNVWNLYPGGTVTLTVHNSIFGEIITMGNASATVVNSICDGTGGYAGSMDTSRLLFVQSQLLCEANARGNSLLTMLLSNIPNHPMHVTDNAVMALLNSGYGSMPYVDAGAASLIGTIDEPTSGFAGQKLRVHGTARLIADPSFPVYLATHWVDVASVGSPDIFLPVTQPSLRDRYRDTLGTWDTRGFAAGEYILRLNMRINRGTNQFDTIRVTRGCRLLDAPLMVEEIRSPEGFHLKQNHPNPFRESTAIRFRIPANEAFSGTGDGGGGGFVSLRLFDLLGREIATLTEGEFEPGEHEIPFQRRQLAPGSYLYRLCWNGYCRTRVLSLLP